MWTANAAQGGQQAAAAAYDWGAAATLVGIGRRGLGFTFKF